MRAVFADTWYFLALLNASDDGHVPAIEFTKAFQGKMVTTGWVLTELADGLANTPDGRNEFLTAYRDLQTDRNVEIVPYSEQIMEKGVQYYAARPDKHWSLTDCISFVIMQERGILEALTRDRHFEQAGFVRLFH